MKAIQIALVAIVLCSCASQSTPPQKAAASPPAQAESTQSEQSEQSAEDALAAARTARARSKYVCKRERGTGTHMSKTVCRTRKQIEVERDHARRVLENTRVYNDMPVDGQGN